MRVSRAVILMCALFASLLPVVAQKKADVRVVESKAVRDGANITVDGKVLITGEKVLRGLVIVFDFRSPEKAVITTQKTVVDEGSLVKGKEGVFHAEMADSVRAVTYVVRAFDMHEKELSVANSGPFSIE
jgi:hypothetical protein